MSQERNRASADKQHWPKEQKYLELKIVDKYWLLSYT